MEIEFPVVLRAQLKGGVLNEQVGVVLSVGLARAVVGPQHLLDGSSLTTGIERCTHAVPDVESVLGAPRAVDGVIVEGVDGLNEGILGADATGAPARAIPATASRVISDVVMVTMVSPATNASYNRDPYSSPAEAFSRPSATWCDFGIARQDDTM